MAVDQPPPSQNGAKLSVPQHNGAPQRPSLGKKRPSELRMENRAAYRAATSIYHRKKNSDEAGRTVGVKVSWSATNLVSSYFSAQHKPTRSLSRIARQSTCKPLLRRMT
jgi:hypothetical protein